MQQANNQPAPLEPLYLVPPREIKTMYEKAYPLVSAFVTAKGGQAEDAQDLMQEAMIVYAQLSGKAEYGNQRLPASFVAAVARNIWHKQFRREVSFKAGRVAMPELKVESLALRNLALQDRLKLLGEIVECLDAESRQVLLYFYEEGMTMNEIARRMGYASGQVIKNKKKKALELLRAFFLRNQSDHGFSMADTD
jgi:RNA polymerase sigma factor (sigma-70 family)